jgi:hypothetical protein
MTRELNPELFPELQKKERPAVAEPQAGAAAGERNEDFRLLLAQFEMLKRKFKEYEARLETTNTRMNDFVNATKAKYDRLAGMTQRLEEMAKASLQDLANKQSQLMSKVNERKVGDTKIQELVDRHNQLVLNFEQRMAQMQKVVSEQEMQLTVSRAELKEAQREFARMKRL